MNCAGSGDVARNGSDAFWIDNARFGGADEIGGKGVFEFVEARFDVVDLVDCVGVSLAAG